MRSREPGMQDGTGCGPRMIQSGQSYTHDDKRVVAEWLDERAAGYPLNPNLFGIGRWPAESPHAIRLHGPDRACFNGACCRERRKEIECANNAAYHGDIDGDFDY